MGAPTAALAAHADMIMVDSGPDPAGAILAARGAVAVVQERGLYGAGPGAETVIPPRAAASDASLGW